MDIFLEGVWEYCFQGGEERMKSRGLEEQKVKEILECWNDNRYAGMLE